MPIFTLNNGIEFFYNDSGIPSTSAYTTYFVVHGHTFHSGVFRRLLPVAHKNSHRMITVNRREYPGSTPYTQAELDVFAQGSNDERLNLLLNQGTNLAFLLDGLIQSLSLPPDIVIVGWSLGNLFTLSLLASITSLPQTVRNRLALSVHKTIMWDITAHCIGMHILPMYIPLFDLDIPLEARSLAFLKWIGYYFMHGDSSKHDVAQLDQGYCNVLNRRSTFDETAPEEVAEITDFNPGPRCDNRLLDPGAFLEVERIIANKALFDASTRSAWSGMDVWNFVGDASIPTAQVATWSLEDQPTIYIAAIKGANHFQMWDDPEGCMMDLHKLQSQERPS
ncbi:hypothetical protein BT96DRAFT_569113 [Gymnopus androsaceus JB14]|uniref:Uncharacterized protein n=1 Tax=Gymnopus androsaceus JB14 TaxID=1447944 RepID=A0A6A4HS80_9AGAR|nr:hypothetical protein BT96DRAFT_569113 [Gymnopus androsaceus JB14]